MSKKAQLMGTPLFYVIGTIILVMFLIMGYNAVKSIMNKGCETELVMLEENLKSELSLMSSQTGSIEKMKIEIPCNAGEIYFIDTNEMADEALQGEEALIYDSWESGAKQNVFLMKEGNIERSMYIPDLKLKYPYYRCLEPWGTSSVEAHIEGYNGGSDIKPISGKYNCGPIILGIDEDEIENILAQSFRTTDDDGNDIDNSIANKLNNLDLDKEQIKDKVQDTKPKVEIRRNIDKEDSQVTVSITIKPKGGSLSDFIYIEHIPKGCIINDNLEEAVDEDNTYYLEDTGRIFERNNIGSFTYANDPQMMWQFNSIDSQEDIEYTLSSILNPDCMDLIKGIGFEN